MNHLYHRSSRVMTACFAMLVFALTAITAEAGDVMLSQYSSDNTPASVLDARVQFSVAGSVLTVSVENRTDNNNPAATYNINEVYFNKSSAVTGLSVNMLPTPGWQLQTNSSNVGSFGSFDFKLEGGNGANTPDKVAPGETKVFKFNITGTGVDEDDFCMEVSDGSRPVIVACKFVNGEGNVVEDDDSAFGGGGMVDDDCMIPPSCTITPSGPLKITIGESVEFEVCSDSMCDGDTFIDALDAPDWCEQVQDPRGGTCETYLCTPPAPGMYELKFMATDEENDLTSMCSIMIEVNDEMCMEPPTCAFEPAGPIKVVAGQTMEVEFCYASGCNDIRPLIQFSGIANPFNSVTSPVFMNGEYCVTLTFSPDAEDVGTHTLNVEVTDADTGAISMCSIMIEVNEPPCMEPPTCEITPAGPLKITLGESAQFEVCGESSCGDGSVMVEPVNGPQWCVEQTLPVNESCRGFSCTPPTAGMHTLEFKVTDQENQLSRTCSITIEVNEPCMEPPECSFDPPGPIKIIAGESAMVDFCFAASCDGNSVSYMKITEPEFASHNSPVPGDGGVGLCTTFTLSPTEMHVGMHTLEYQAVDLDNGMTTNCSIMIEVNEPCQEPPVCTITPQGPIMAYVGEEFSFEVCGESPCDSEYTITPLNLPDWCSEEDLRFNGDCLVVTCTPPNNAEGTYTFDFKILDPESQRSSVCSVDVEVVCHLEPMCFFTEDGPIRVAVGEEIDFEFCGASVCEGHKARIEMKSRPPFIDPAGHLKGGPDETLCLPIKGTPRSSDIGSWRVVVTAEDLDTGVQTQCEIRIIVTGPPQCEDSPLCEIEQDETIEASPGETVSIDLCAISACDEGTVEVSLPIAPDFCGPFEPVFSEPGEEVCVTLDCVIPEDVEPGEYLIRFRTQDLGNNQRTDCEVTIVIPETNTFTCMEEEPNDDFSTCTLLDIGDCLDLGCGSSVIGVLGTEGDDVDFYCFTGLAPFSEYIITVISGIDCDGAPTCASLACLDANGEIINATESGGPAEGYPAITCFADANGFIQIAVSGCEDLDVDGMADGDDRGGIGHGSSGSYQMAIQPLTPNEINMACHADMNGDGIVDSGDLGLLIGVFGESCAPE